MNTAAAIARLVAVLSPPLVATLSQSYRYHPSSGPHPAIDNDDVYVVFCLRCSLCAARLGGRAADVNGGEGDGQLYMAFLYNILLHCLAASQATPCAAQSRGIRIGYISGKFMCSL